MIAKAEGGGDAFLPFAVPNAAYYRSLDGVHPTAIGQSIVAHEFLKVMKRAGVAVDGSLNWPAIFKSDALYCDPLSLMHELYNKDWLAKYLLERFSERRQPL
jgi:hypothetical protein